MKRIYAYPVLMRAGLANMLMPWARAMLWGELHDAPVLAPRWFKLRLGPYRRKESDKRRYERCFTTENTVSGWQRASVLALAKIVDESDRAMPDGTRAPIAVRFSGLGEYLSPLLGHHRLLDERLRAMTRRELLPASGGEFVGVHVRLGDYPTKWRLPIDWYAKAIAAVAVGLGHDVPVRIYSDGSEEELSPLLRLPNVEWADRRPAVTDLLELSQAACIVASASTFSAWAGFLRQAPIIWYPGRTMRSHDDAHSGSCVEWDGDPPLPERLLAEMERRLSVRSTHATES